MAHSFFKFLLRPSRRHLALPAAFVRKHLGNIIPKGPIKIVAASGGRSWNLKIKKIGEEYCFTAGWVNVVKDIPLVIGDFLIFHHAHQSIFHLEIFKPNGCEQVLPRIDHRACVDDHEEEEEKEEEEQDDPFFTSIITKTHKITLRFPAKFSEAARINGERAMVVKNIAGKEWKTRLKVEQSHGTPRFYLTSGWSVFFLENCLSEGDECVFRFVRSEGKLLLANVTKNEWPVTEPLPLTAVSGKKMGVRPAKQPQPAGKVPVTETVKRKRGRPRKEDGVKKEMKG